MRILLDTNVLIDLYTQREPEGDTAQKLLIMKEFGDAQLWVSAKSFTDVFYVLSKSYSSKRIQAAFRESLDWLEVCSVDGGDIKLASEREWNDFEDCLVAVCAEKVKAAFILTRDERGFKQCDTPACSPQAFFDMLESERGVVYGLESL